MKRICMAFLLLVFLQGCATYQLVQPHQRKNVAGVYSVQSTIPWSAIKKDRFELWTVDGTLLQSMHFFAAIEDGEALFQVGDKEKRPRFHSSMSESEVVDFIVDAITSAGAQSVNVVNLQPTKFGDYDGFHVVIEYFNADGLEQRGIVVGMLHNEKLYLVTYTGAKNHYFPKYVNEVERIIQTIEVNTNS